MNYDLKAYKKKEKDMVGVICALKNRGYPVSEVIEQVASAGRAKGRSSEPPPPPELPTDDETDTEPIVSGPPKAVIKPDSVPVLNFSLLEPDSDSSS
jgi:hypothetical protein